MDFLSFEFHRVSEEVLYAKVPAVVILDEQRITALIEESRATPRRRMRICTHAGVADAVHEMLIVHERGTYVPPHKHLGRSESFHVVKGRADIIVFNDDESIRSVISMGEYGSNLAFYYRLNESLFHTLYIHSEVFVFHETGVGPFDKSKSVLAPWAPDEKNAVQVTAFMKKLENILQKN